MVVANDSEEGGRFTELHACPTMQEHLCSRSTKAFDKCTSNATVTAIVSIFEWINDK